MIFVTVGTTLPFDGLIAEVDRLAASGAIAEPVICQIGHGEYLPKHCEYFRFTPRIDEYVEQSSLVIGHGGTGTVTSLLASGKPFVVVANPLGAGGHQAQFLKRLAAVVSFVWTDDIGKLAGLVERARQFQPATMSGQRLTDDLRAYLSRGPGADA